MTKIHFIGIGGIGMSALAQICLSRGDTVSGSDIRRNNLTENLSAHGAKIEYRHAKNNITDELDLVVVSSAIKKDNPETLSAKEKGIEIITRSEFLRQLMQESASSIAVTGTHGKTTTSALIAHIMEKAGEDPTIVLGGEIETINGNGKYGRGKTTIAEVDESDGYFRDIRSEYAVVTNIEREHIENFSGWEDVLDAYKSFISKISPDGALVFNGEDKNIRDILDEARANKVSFGITGENDVTCENLIFDKKIKFDLKLKGEEEGKVESSLIGQHNVMNLLAGISVCMQKGIQLKEILAGIKSFKGVKRRFEEIGKIGGVRVIEDYAHHPTEIKAVIKAARQFSDGRVVVIFQPHRYSRTLDLIDDFSSSFTGCDHLILTEIYSADETEKKGISIMDMYKRFDHGNFEKIQVLRKEDIAGIMPDIVRDDDIILILGAGDIREIGPGIVESIRKTGLSSG